MNVFSPRIQRREWLVLAAIVVFAMAIRLYAAAQPRVAWGDEPIYLWAGQSLLNGTGFYAMGYSGAHTPPLFSVAAAGLAPLVGGLFNASNLVYVVAGSLLVVPLYLLARAIYGQPAAWMTGLVVALYPALVTGVLKWGTMTEPLYLLWVGVAIYALYLALEHGGTRHYALLGIALGLAYLTRTEALVFVAAVLGLLLIGRLLRRDRLAPLLGRLAITAGLFLLVASPYLLYMHNITGRWSLTGEAGMAFTTMTGLAERDPAAFDRATWGLDEPSGEVYYFAPSSEAQPLAAVLLNDPAGVIGRLKSGLKDTANLLFSVRLVPWSLASLLFLGLFAQPWPARRLRGELALIASLAAPASYLPFFVQDRYLAGTLLPATVWIGAGAWLLGCWLAGTVQNLLRRPLPAAARRALLVAPALLLALLLVALQPRVWTALERTHSFQPGHLAAAAELRAQRAPADAVVMSRYPAIAFHAGTRWAATPAEDWPKVLAYARQRDARYLAFDGWEAQLRPQLAFLLDPAQAPPELRHLATITSGNDPVVLYEFQ